MVNCDVVGCRIDATCILNYITYCGYHFYMTRARESAESVIRSLERASTYLGLPSELESKARDLFDRTNHARSTIENDETMQ